jgi:hypothetical protein
MCIAQVGTITAPTAGGVPLAENITLPAGSAPKAILLFCTGQTAVDQAPAQGDAILCQGMATYNGGAVQQDNWSALTKEAQGTSDSGRARAATRCLQILIQTAGAAPTVDGSLSLVSMSDTQVALQWEVIPSVAYRVHYVIFGRASLTAACVVARDVDSITVGANLDVTVAAGFGQPDALLHFWTRTITVPTLSNGNAGWALGGALKDSTVRSSYLVAGDNQATPLIGSYQSTLFLGGLQAGTGIDAEWTLAASSSWPTDGFRFSQPANAPANATDWTCITLALKGAFTASAGAADSHTTTDTQDLTLASGTPNGALIWSTGVPTNAGADTTHADLGQFMIGAWDGTSEWCCGMSIEDNGADSNTGGHSSVAKSFRSHVPDATLTNAPTLTAEADGSLTATAARLTWSDGDALAREFNYMVFGAVAPVTDFSQGGLVPVGFFSSDMRQEGWF